MTGDEVKAELRVLKKIGVAIARLTHEDVCPDGRACPDPECQAAHRIIDRREAHEARKKEQRA